MNKLVLLPCSSAASLLESIPRTPSAQTFPGSYRRAIRSILLFMKTTRTALASALLLGIHCAVQVNTASAAAFVDFIWPANGQQLVTFTGVAGSAQAATGTIQQVVFSIYDQTIGQWWNGTNYQAAPASLSALSGGKRRVSSYAMYLA